MDQINDRIVSVLEDMSSREGEAEEEGMDTAVAATIVLDNCFTRNRRCLMAYTHDRLRRIRQFYRRYGYSTKIDHAILDSLADHEREFLDDYAKLITDYNMAVGVDLGSDLHPPRDLFVRVKALVNRGEITTATGTMRLIKNHVYVMREADADTLIIEGIVRVLKEN